MAKSRYAAVIFEFSCASLLITLVIHVMFGRPTTMPAKKLRTRKLVYRPADDVIRLNKRYVTTETAASTSSAVELSTQSGSVFGLFGPNEYYRRRDAKVNEYRHRVVFGPSRQPVCLNDTRMLVLVHSHPSYVDKRQAIRDTWGGPIRAPGLVTWPHIPSCCQRIRLFFVVGLDRDRENAIRQEQSQHDDILQGDFIDSYRNMTLKSLLGLKIFTEHCRYVKYLLKSDDDMFINFPFLLHRIDKNTLSRAIMGPLLEHAPVFREGKWALTFEEFKFPYFPPYMPGSAYVITGDIVPQLLETSDYVPYIFIDDVYVTGILGRIVNVTMIGGRHKREFALSNSRPARACFVIGRRVITATRMTPRKLRAVWRQLGDLKPGSKQYSKCV